MAAYKRNAVVNLVNAWVGKNEKDGSYKSILELYNGQPKKPRGVTMKPGMAWCATTWSALAIALKYTKIMPVECSCYYLIKAAQKMGVWVENDAYVPKPGDACLYDWQDNGVGDNKGTPDHVGVVTYVNKKEGYFVVTEGNYSKSVKKRTVSINGKFIRGFITPKYDDSTASAATSQKQQTVGKDNKTVAHEVIAGAWGTTNASIIKNLTAKHYDADKILTLVNTIVNTPSGTTSTTCKAAKFDKKLAKKYTATKATCLRNDAGSNKKLLVKVPAKAKITCYGYYTTYNKVKWLLVEVTVSKVKYTGFIASTDLKEV